MNKLKSIITRLSSIIILMGFVFSLSTMDVEAEDFPSTNVNKYLITNLGSSADIKDVVDYIDNNWTTGKKLSNVGYFAMDQGCGNPNEHFQLSGMNCTGLVGYVFRNCKSGTTVNLNQIGDWRYNGWYANATNWQYWFSGHSAYGDKWQNNKTWYNANACRTYRFSSLQDLLNSNVYVKGDVLYCEPTQWAWVNVSGADCHIGFYWGNYHGHNQFMHCSIYQRSGVQCTDIHPKTTPSIYYIVKSAPSRITFNKNTTDNVGNMPANGKKFMGSAYVFPSNIPTRTGYTFLGWNVNKNATSGVQPGFNWWCSDENQTVYAIWSKTTYSVKYDANGGTGAPTAGKKGYNMNYTVSSTIPKRAGYEFLGWSENKNATTATYKAGDTLKENRAYTLYAIWKLGNSTISIDMNGGSLLDNYPSSQTVKTYNSAIIDLSKISNQGKVGYDVFNLVASGNGTFGAVGYNTNWANKKGDIVLSGKALYADDCFENGTNGVKAYNIKGGDQVKIERVMKGAYPDVSNSCDTPSNWMLKITTTGTTAGPGLGGFSQTPSEYWDQYGIYYHTFYAKVPKGYCLEVATKHKSEEGNATIEWITDNKGTGEWKWYQYKLNGDTRGFAYDSVLGVFLYPGTGVKAGTIKDESHTVPYDSISFDTSDVSYPVSWYIGYSNLFNATSTESLKTLGAMSDYQTTHKNYGQDQTIVGRSAVMKDSEIPSGYTNESLKYVKQFTITKGNKYRFNLGGFYNFTTGKSGNKYLYSIYAKIPNGYTVNIDRSDLKTKTNNSDVHWITDNQGTGTWRWYQCEITLGSSYNGTKNDVVNAIFISKDSSKVYKAGADANTEYENYEKTATTATETINWYLGSYTYIDESEMTTAGCSTLYDSNIGIYKLNIDTSNKLKWTSAGDALLYASFTPNKYKVHYDTNGGKNEIGDIEYTYNEEYTTPTVVEQGTSIVKASDLTTYGVEKTVKSTTSFSLKATYSSSDKNKAGVGVPESKLSTGKKYKLSFKFKDTSNLIKNIGGHCYWYNIDHVIIDGKYYDDNSYAWNQGYNIDTSIETHTVDLYFSKKSSNTFTSDKNFYIQPNRNHISAGVKNWTCDITDFSLTQVNSFDDVNLKKTGYHFIGWNSDVENNESTYKTVENGSYNISPVGNDNLVINTTVNFDALEMAKKNDTLDQLYHIKYVSDGYYEIINEAYNNRINLAYDKNWPMVQKFAVGKTAKATTNELWRFIKQDDGSYLIKSKCSEPGETGTKIDTTSKDWYLTINTYIDEDLNQEVSKLKVTDDVNAATRWNLSRNDVYQFTTGDYMFLLASDTSKVMDIQNGEQTDGSIVKVWTNNNSSAQKFRVTQYADGFATIANTRSRLMRQKVQINLSDKNVGAGDANITTWDFTKPSDYQGDHGGFLWKFLNVGDGNYVAVAIYNNRTYYMKQGDKNLLRTTFKLEDAARFKIKKVYNIDNGYYYINNFANSNLTLDVNYFSTDNGANVQIWDKHYKRNQLFKLNHLDAGYYTIQNDYSGKYLNVDSNNIKSGGNVQQWSSDSLSNKNSSYWNIAQDLNGGQSIFSEAGDKLALDINNPNGTLKSGANVQIWTGNATTGQIYGFEKAIDASVKKGTEKGSYILDTYSKLPAVEGQTCQIRLADNQNFVLSIDKDKISSLSNVSLNKINTTASTGQKFVLNRTASGYYTIASPSNSKAYLNIYNPKFVSGTALEGANVQIYVESNGVQDNENWRLIHTGSNTYYIQSKTGHYLTYTGDLEKGTANLVVTNDKSKAKAFTINIGTYTYKAMKDGKTEVINTINTYNSTSPALAMWYPKETGLYEIDATLKTLDGQSRTQRIRYEVTDVADQSTADLVNGSNIYNLTSENGKTLNMTAVWDPNKYTLRLHSNYGKDEISYQSMTYDQSASINTPFLREGYKLVGWSKTPNNYDITKVDYKVGATVKNLTSTDNGNYDLYAVWKEISYKVVYHSNLNPDTTIAEPNTFKSGVIYTYRPATTFSNTGYKIVGWGLTPNATTYGKPGSEFCNLADEDGATVHLYAIWNPITYKLSFDANDDGVKPAPKGTMDDMSCDYGQSYTIPDSGYTREGYTFMGWSVNPSSSTVKYKVGQTVQNLTATDGATIKLYAVWKLNKYQITYNWNTAHDKDSYVETKTYNCNKAYNLLQESTSTITGIKNKTVTEGYTFLGWAESPDANKAKYPANKAFTNMTTEDGKVINLYGVWKANTYTIKFDGNGATSGTMKDISCTYDQDVTLTKNTFKKTGYVFLGWGTTSSSTTVKYKDQQTVKNLTSKDKDTVIIYAIWAKLPDIITDDIYIFENEKDQVNADFVETESHLKAKDNKYNITVSEYHVTNMEAVKQDINKNKIKTTVKFDVTYSCGNEYTTTATCKLNVVKIVHDAGNDDRIHYIEDPTYVKSSSIWSDTTKNQILRHALGMKPNDVSGYEINK